MFKFEFTNKPNKESTDDIKKMYNNFGKGFGVLFLIIAIFIISSQSFYTINEQEQAVVTTFGIAKTVNESGLHLKVPFLQKINKVDTTIRGLYIGYDPTTNETYEIESMMITNDFNFVNVDFFVEYRVADPIKFLYASEKPITILKNIAQSDIRTVVGSYNVDDVITTGKFKIQSQIKEMILGKLEKNDIGIQFVNISIQDSEPPTLEVMEAFKAVETAKQGKETSINNANKYRNEELPKALADVDKIMQKAESTKAERVNKAESQVAMFNEMYTEYVKNPLITKQRMYYETMEEVLPSLKVIIGSNETSVQSLLPIEPFNQ